MRTRDELENDLMKWVCNVQGESFLLDEAVDAMADGESFVSDEDRDHFNVRIRNILDTFDNVARPLSSDTYYILETFFKGTVFYCKPRPFELKEGILVTGCRFEPFHPAEIFPDELEIKTSSGRISLRGFSCDCAMVNDLYFLLGPAGTIDMLSAESQENYEALRDADGLKDHVPLVMDVFDFGAFYEKTGFRTGDLIRFEIESFMNGTLKAERVDRVDAPSGARLDKWIESFEKALTTVCHDFKDSLEIPAQLMMAYITAADSGRDVRRIPGPPIDLYHTMMRDISFNRNGIEWTLAAIEDDEEEEQLPEEDHGCECGHEHHDGETCSCGHDHEKKDISPDDFSASAGNIESLEAILKETHAPVNETELYALMFSTLANGSDDFEEFARTNSDLIKIGFKDEAQEAAFLNFTEDYWEDLAGKYGYNLDSLKAPLRERLLELVRRRVELLPALNKLKDDSIRMEMNRVRRDIDETLAFLDRDAVLEDDASFEELELRVGDIEDAFDLVADKLEQ